MDYSNLAVIMDESTLCTGVYAWKEFYNPNKHCSSIKQTGECAYEYCKRERKWFKKIAVERLCKKAVAQFYLMSRKFENFDDALAITFQKQSHELTPNELEAVKWIYRCALAEAEQLMHRNYLAEFESGDFSNTEDYEDFLRKSFERNQRDSCNKSSNT